MAMVSGRLALPLNHFINPNPNRGVSADPHPIHCFFILQSSFPRSISKIATMYTTASFSLISSPLTLPSHRQLRPQPSRVLIHQSLNRLAPRQHQSTASSSSHHRFRCVAMGREQESLGVPTSVPVKVAHELLQAGHRYLDVRTPEEFSAGHASGAINIPYMYRTGSGMAKNPKFLDEVAAEFGKDDEIIVGCQSGKRSMMAAEDLLSAGFVGVTDIAGGYAAWAQTGLPTEV